MVLPISGMSHLPSSKLKAIFAGTSFYFLQGLGSVFISFFLDSLLFSVLPGQGNFILDLDIENFGQKTVLLVIM
jgi:hypothetical protein